MNSGWLFPFAIIAGEDFSRHGGDSRSERRALARFLRIRSPNHSPQPDMTGIQQLQRYAQIFQLPLPVLVTRSPEGAVREIPAHPGLLSGALILAEDPGEPGRAIWTLRYPSGEEVPVTAKKPAFPSQAMPGYVAVVEFPAPAALT